MGIFGGLQEKREQRMQGEMLDKEIQAEKEGSALSMAVGGMEFNQNPELVRWQQDLIDELNQHILDLQRLKKSVDADGNVRYDKITYFDRINEEGKEVYKRAKPIMNNLGINAFKTFIRPMISRNLLMSNFSEEQILNKLKHTTISWISHLALHFQDYSIDVSNLSMLTRLFKSISEPGCFRALANGERNFLTTTSKRAEIVTSSDPATQKKQNALKDLLG